MSENKKSALDEYLSLTRGDLNVMHLDEFNSKLYAARIERDDLTHRLEATEKLVEKWHVRAMESVPPEYADRNLHGKYLKLDNSAAGMDDCADELAAALELESKG
jgi:hypothetical protein